MDTTTPQTETTAAGLSADTPGNVRAFPGRRWTDAVNELGVRAREATRYGEQRIQQNPWAAIGVGFGAGVLIGALLALAAGRR